MLINFSPEDVIMPTWYRSCDDVQILEEINQMEEEGQDYAI
jgi:hypothetical protein